MNNLREKGFTLIELMITLVIAAIVITIGVPSFQQLINNNLLTASTNEFVTAVNLARSEAVKRGVVVTLCKSASGSDCSNSGNYDQGWIVFENPNSDLTVDADETIIRVFDERNDRISLQGNSDPIENYISFRSDGTSRQENGAFLAGTVHVCADLTVLKKRKRVILSRTGRVRVETDEGVSACM